MRSLLTGTLALLYALATLLGATVSGACSVDFTLCTLGSEGTGRSVLSGDPWWYRWDAWQWDAFAVGGAASVAVGLVFLALALLAPGRTIEAGAALATHGSLLGVMLAVSPPTFPSGLLAAAVLILVCGSGLLYVRAPRQTAGTRRE